MRASRSQTLLLLVEQAERNGFDFRAWWMGALGGTWSGPEKAAEALAAGTRYYALIFSHAFARAFWKQGTRMPFAIGKTTYTVRKATGEMVTITRKPYTRRTLKADAWEYHLREMVAQEKPLLYLRRFLVVAEPKPPRFIP